MDVASRWEELKALFEQATTLPPDKRAAFLDEACQDAPDLRSELDSLLAHHEEAPGYFERLARSVFQPSQEAIEEKLRESDQIISHYRVLEKLGGGGMGVVYKAHDTKLGRTVALKFLPPHLSTSEEAKARFIHEAKAASALDHPNIATIHEIGETDDGQLFIAMAYYRGETLKKKIAGGPLSLDEALNYAAQVARGLAKAHAQDIIHRDVKPANVIVTEDGIAKVLDFGLAKIADVQLTRTGTTLGTVSYMSPEQARGEGVDHRTDIWSLGVVLYEMLTGERPFKGDYPEAIIYSVLNEAPKPLAEGNPDVPPDLEHVLMMCLEKDKELRYPSVSDLLADLKVWTKEETAPRLSRVRTVLVAGMSVLVTLLVLLTITIVTGRSGLPNQKHLVVLSAISADSDSSDQTFTSGLVETLTRKLERSKDRSFWVVTTRDILNNPVSNSIEAWEIFDVNLAIIVDAKRDEDTIRVTLDLVDALSQQSQKSATIVRSVGQPAALDKDLVTILADLLEINPLTLSDLAAGGTVIPGAYQFYTNGMGYLRDYGKYRNIKHIHEAINQFQHALEEDSIYAQAYAGLGEAYWRKYANYIDDQWIEAAVQHSQRAMELNDDFLEGYATLGYVETTMGRYGSAILAFRYALERDSAFTDAYRGLARAYETVGRLDEAEEAYHQAIRMKKDYWGGYNELGAFLSRQGRYEDAAAQFQAVIDLAEANPRGYRNLASMYFYLGRKEEAYKEYQKALEVQPDDYTTHHNLASIYYNEGLYTDAAEAFANTLGINDTDFRVWGSLGSAYTWSGQHNKARDAYEQAIIRAEDQLAVNPRNPATLTFLAEYHTELEDYERADSLLTQALALNPTATDLLFRIGEVYELLDDRDQALTWIEKALQKGYPITSHLRHPVLKDLFTDERFQRLQEQYRRDEH